MEANRFKLDELKYGIRKRILSTVPHAEKILYVEEYDPSHGGYVDTHESKRYRVAFVYQGKEWLTSISIGNNKFFE